MPDLLFYKICGNTTTCAGKTCISCCNKILSIGDIKQGILVEYCCPFCISISPFVSKYFSMTTLKISRESLSLLKSHYIAWCKKCDYLKLILDENVNMIHHKS